MRFFSCRFLFVLSLHCITFRIVCMCTFAHGVHVYRTRSGTRERTKPWIDQQSNNTRASDVDSIRVKIHSAQRRSTSYAFHARAFVCVFTVDCSSTVYTGSKRYTHGMRRPIPKLSMKTKQKTKHNKINNTIHFYSSLFLYLYVFLHYTLIVFGVL